MPFTRNNHLTADTSNKKVHRIFRFTLFKSEHSTHNFLDRIFCYSTHGSLVSPLKKNNKYSLHTALTLRNLLHQFHNLEAQEIYATNNNVRSL